MVGYYWKEVAVGLVPRHARRIAASILHEQADRQSGTWFVEYSDAYAVLQQCIKVDPAGVWQELVPFLSSPADAQMFIIGFPQGLIEQMPAVAVEQWISESVEERAAIVARLVSKDLLNDDTMASRLIDSFGDKKSVAGVFFRPTFLEAGGGLHQNTGTNLLTDLRTSRNVPLCLSFESGPRTPYSPFGRWQSETSSEKRKKT